MCPDDDVDLALVGSRVNCMLDSKYLGYKLLTLNDK